MVESSAVGKRGVLAVVASGNLVQLGSRILLGALVPLILVQFGVSKSVVGLALTGMWGVYSLLQFPSGVLADRYGEKPLLVTGLSGTILGTVLVVASPSFPVFAAAILVLGAGAGLYYAPAMATVDRIFEESGGPISVITAVGVIAGIVYPAVGSAVGVRYGWRPAVGLSLVVAVPVLLGVLYAVPALASANPDRSLGESFDYRQVWGFITRPSIAYTTFMGFVFSFTFQAFVSFFPTFLVEYRGVEPGTAGLLFGAVFFISSPSQVVGGRLSDRFSRDGVLSVSTFLMMTGLAVLLAVPGPGGLVVGAGVLGLGTSWPGALQARFMDMLGDHERGYGFGLARSVYLLLASSGSVVVGSAADAVGWTLAYGIVVALLGLCLGLILTNRVLSAGL